MMLIIICLIGMEHFKPYRHEMTDFTFLMIGEYRFSESASFLSDLYDISLSFRCPSLFATIKVHALSS